MWLLGIEFRTSAYSSHPYLLSPCLLWPEDLFVCLFSYVCEFTIAVQMVVSLHVVVGN